VGGVPEDAPASPLLGTGRLLLAPDVIAADRTRWLEARRGGIGASEAAMLLDLAPERVGGRYTLYHRKRQGLESGDTAAMERGRYLEPYVADQYADTHPQVDLRRGGLYCHADRPWMLASPDRMASEWEHRVAAGVVKPATWPVELKTSIPEDEFGQEGEFTYLPAYHRAQGLWQMEVLGTNRVDIPVLFIRPWEVRVFTLTRDARAQRDIDLLVAAGEEMMWRLENDRPPPVDATPACTDTLRKLYPGLEDRAVKVPIELARRYRGWLAHRAMAEERLNLARNEILERMGNATRAVAIDRELGRPRDGWMVKVASRTAGRVKRHTIKAKRRVDRMNPSGWARG